jgi:hypothetical protein
MAEAMAQFQHCAHNRFLKSGSYTTSCTFQKDQRENYHAVFREQGSDASLNGEIYIVKSWEGCGQVCRQAHRIALKAYWMSLGLIWLHTSQ